MRTLRTKRDNQQWMLDLALNMRGRVQNFERDDWETPKRAHNYRMLPKMWRQKAEHDEALAKLKDPDSARMVARRTTLPLMNINRYLTTLSNGQVSRFGETFMSIETALKISNADYKATRRYLGNFDRLSTMEKKKVATRLALATRAKLRSSDIIIYMEELLAERDLETRSVKDNEPTISVADIGVSGQELSMYRFLVGSKNLVGTKKFLELARSGNSIPSTFVKQYLPAIVLIDDIVKAGPGYVQMLRSLQKRAKQRR